ncbi:MAG: sigma-70 family RNA polymerase sigma factor [Chloroflexi bacterium]|nr:sigma-70 family RNA polymerase sigma factor [Chloroflexota bacterium]
MNHTVSEFESIHDLYRPKIERYLTRMVGEREAEDLTQEVLLKVNQALKAFRGEASLSTWVYRIATNAAIDRMRTASFRQDAHTRSLDESTDGEDKALAAAADATSLEQLVLRTQRTECFQRLLRQLPLTYRAVIVLKDLEELTAAEVAEILGVSLETVKIRLHRGRSRLLRELRAHCKPEDWL